MLVAALDGERGRPALGEPEQAARQLGLVVLRVHPQVGLELAGAELVAGVGVPDQPARALRDPGVARGSNPSSDQSFSRSSSVLSGSPISATSQAFSRSTISGASPRVAGRMRLGVAHGTRRIRLGVVMWREWCPW